MFPMMKTSLSRSFCLAALGVLTTPFIGSAVLFNFDDLGLLDNDPIPVTYGDNLPGAPNITVDYRTVNPGDNSTVASYLSFWNTGYGDLAKVPYAVSNGNLAEISLVPAPGYSVTLQSFDYAGYLSTQPAQTLRVLDENYNLLLDYTPNDFPGSSHGNAAPR